MKVNLRNRDHNSDKPDRSKAVWTQQEGANKKSETFQSYPEFTARGSKAWKGELTNRSCTLWIVRFGSSDCSDSWVGNTNVATLE